MRGKVLLALLAVLLFNARARRLAARLLFQLFKNRRLRRLVLSLIARWFRR